jgi:hypothetical protein
VKESCDAFVTPPTRVGCRLLRSNGACQGRGALRRLVAAYEAAGIEFSANTGRRGVRLAAPAIIPDGMQYGAASPD